MDRPVEKGPPDLSLAWNFDHFQRQFLKSTNEERVENSVQKLHQHISIILHTISIF